MRHSVLTAATLLACTGTVAGALGACGSSAGAAHDHATAALTTAIDTARPGAETPSREPRTARARTSIDLAGHTLRVPAGWHAQVWARVPEARLETWSPADTLLVSEPDDGRILELIPRRGHPGATPTQRTLLSGLSEPQGMAFDHVRGREVLYVAEDDAIDRYVWQDGRATHRRVLVAGLPDTAPAGSDNHELKNVVVTADHRLDIDIGSGSNAGPVQVSTPPRAAVVSYSASGGDPRVLATGVRNGDGLSVAPDGVLWTAVNERDQIAYPFHHADAGRADAYGMVIPAYVTNHPSDEVAALTPGTDLGWPYCDPDPDDRPGVSGTSVHDTDLPFTDDEQTNPHGQRLDCARLPRLPVGLPAHSAPLGFHFLEGSALAKPWSGGAVVAVHGSWDASPPRAPGVLWMPWNGRTRTLGAAVSLISGFQLADGSRWGRPVDAVPGPDGSLYVSDDQAGAVYRFTP